MNKDINKIGLVAGAGKFPILLCQGAREHNVSVVVISINGEADTDFSKYTDKVYSVELGQGKKLIEILKNEGVKYAIMAGKINKFSIFKQGFRMDEVAREVLARVIDKRDNSILRVIADRLKKDGIQLLDSTEFLKGILAEKGIYTARKPTKEEKSDIDFGFKIAKAASGLDIGQTVIIKDKAVVAVEAIEGTDQAIIRSKQLSNNFVVVKVARDNHDNRFDVPTVGLTTIKSMKASGAAVLAIEAQKTLVIDKDKMIKEADAAGICVIAV
ncbi:MAG: UDP-2,3-diacylglucosamine diphosphatase LpxI [Candidatus Omnitrophota bacterium]